LPAAGCHSPRRRCCLPPALLRRQRSEIVTPYPADVAQRDATRRRRTEVAHARRSSASRRKALPLRERALVVDSLSDAVIALDSDGRIVLANEAVKGLLGYAVREIVGRGLCDLLASDESVPTASGVVVRVRHRDGHDVSVAISFGH